MRSSTALVEGRDYRQLTRAERKRTGKKYELLRPQAIETNIIGQRDLEGEDGLVLLERDGGLLVQAGYCWDGASGPTWDTASTMRASLFHDALYQLMREGQLDAAEVRAVADVLLMGVMLSDGAWWLRAWLWLLAVHVGAAYAAKR